MSETTIILCVASLAAAQALLLWYAIYRWHVAERKLAWVQRQAELLDDVLKHATWPWLGVEREFRQDQEGAEPISAKALEEFARMEAETWESIELQEYRR